MTDNEFIEEVAKRWGEFNNWHFVWEEGEDPIKESYREQVRTMLKIIEQVLKEKEHEIK